MSNSFDIQISSRTLWMEFRGEGDEGLLAGAWALVNRHKSGRWYAGKTLAECCIFPSQFSCWNTNDPNRRAVAIVADDDPLLDECRSYIMDAMGDVGDDPTDGATHYYATTLPAPPAWAATGIFTKQVGKTRFYKNVP